MKILILAPRLPHATGKADSMTVFHLVDYLAQRHQVCLACFYEHEDELRHLPELQRRCLAVRCVKLRKPVAVMQMALHALSGLPLQTAYYRDAEMQRTVDEMLATHRPDLAYAHLIRMGEYLKQHREVKRVLAMQISQTLNYRRMISHMRLPFYRALYQIEYAKVRRYEPRIMRSFDSCLLISKHDKSALAGHETMNNVFYSPHGVDLDYYRPRTSQPKEHALLFCGVMETPTNLDAALWFHEAIYPLIRKAVPDVRLYLVGKRPPRAIRALAEQDPSVIVTGFVPDTRDYYERARVGIDPMRIGAGLQNKLLIGMCMEQAVVCTSIANEGIGGQDGEHLIIADEPQPFAQAVIGLLKEPAKAQAMGLRARAFVEAGWSWEHHFQALERHLLSLSTSPFCMPMDDRLPHPASLL